MVLNAIERGLEGGSRNMTAPQILDHSRGRVLRVVGHMKEYPPSASFEFLLLFPSSEGWVLGKVLFGIGYSFGEKRDKHISLVASIHEAAKEEDKLLLNVLLS